MKRTLLIFKIKEKIEAMEHYKNSLNFVSSNLNNAITDLEDIRKCLKNDGNLNDIQKVTRYNYPVYFKMLFETNIFNKSLRDLLNENGTQIENIKELQDINVLISTNEINYKTVTF
jgi:hypothetical protein